ncbi:SDR family NAD(P)-dependent oxidoreductase [Streptomyces deccanensis]|uniref:SDR family NAD(P)-dependent oxidoreductase n=1 Tax=Streptomyces deccanensis TaxID=424188 RepID=UPI001EFB4D74|nr:SDR family oxidoreductase [Streptomyces deccanensis]ULR47905.1 SDR family oxidoreductase [Streptomyces deccanensis]
MHDIVMVEAALDGGDQVVGVGEGPVRPAGAPRHGPQAFHRVEVGCVGRQLDVGEPLAVGGVVAHSGGEVGVQKCPKPDRLGRIDYLFVNQGIAEFQTLEEVTEESWDRIIDVNAKGAFFTVQRLAPLMSEGGSIVFTTVSNDQIFPGLGAYSGAKEAVAAFVKVLAAELLPRRIRVNAIAPGFIITPTMGVAELTDEQRAEFIEQGNASTPMGRGRTVEEIAAAALYLAVEATFTTGVDCPWTAGSARASANDTTHPVSPGLGSTRPTRELRHLQPGECLHPHSRAR